MNRRRINSPLTVILSAAKDPRAKHMNQTRSVSILLLALLLIATIAPAVTAQDTAADIPTLLIQAGDGTPASAFYAEVEPGERAEIEISLAVVADDPIDVTTAIANAVAAPNGGFSLAPTDAPLTGPAAWLDYDGGPLTLETGESVTRTVEIAVPADASPGQYVVALALTATEPVPIPDADEASQLVRASAAIAITVPGEFESGFDLGDPAFIGSGSSGVVQIPVANTGTVPVHPQGTLTLEGPGGEAVANVPVAMGAIFAGGDTMLQATLPEWPPAGDYRLALDLTDADTGATATLADLADVTLTVTEPPPGARDPKPFDASPEAGTVTFESVAIEPQGTPLESVEVAVEVSNVGNPIPSATLTLEVSRDGALVEEVAIAGDIALADGVTSYATTYAPEGGYGSGIWSFRIRLDAIAPDGTATLLIQTGTVAKIDVP